jgi:uncharacterized membrane protein YoaK (UPF0700 family)
MAMLLTIRYCKGYGWHVGRPIQWVALLLLGIPLAFIAVFAGEALRFHQPIPFALIAPLIFLLLLQRRLMRKLNGEPFAVCLPQFFVDDMATLLISRGHRHFRALVMLEIFIWGSVIAAQLGIILTSYRR